MAIGIDYFIETLTLCCDKCQEEKEYTEVGSEAVVQAESAGWTSDCNGISCPFCNGIRDEG